MQRENKTRNSAVIAEEISLKIRELESHGKQFQVGKCISPKLNLK